MICRPCRERDHEACPETARRVSLILSGEEASAHVGQVCDCQHELGAVLAPGTHDHAGASHE